MVIKLIIYIFLQIYHCFCFLFLGGGISQSSKRPKSRGRPTRAELLKLRLLRRVWAMGWMMLGHGLMGRPVPCTHSVHTKNHWDLCYLWMVIPPNMMGDDPSPYP